MAFCSQCGNAVPDDAKFCSACGQAIAAADVRTVASEPETVLNQPETAAQQKSAPPQEAPQQPQAPQQSYYAPQQPQAPQQSYYAPQQPQAPQQSYYATQQAQAPQQSYYATQQPKTPQQSYYAQQQAPNPQQNKYGYQQNYQKPPYQSGSADVEENKGICVLCYLGILLLIPLLSKPNSAYVRYHSNQGLVLLIFSIVIGILMMIPYLGWFLIGPVGYIFTLVCIIMGIVNTVGGQMKPLPLIGGISLIK